MARDKKRQSREYAEGASEGDLVLRLYVTGWSPRCVSAYRRLQKICQDYAPGSSIEVVDILEYPEAARKCQIVAVPALLKLSPEPQRVLVGDFSQVDRVLNALDIEPAATIHGHLGNDVIPAR